MSNLQLAKNLIYMRRKNNLTQDDLGRILNISRQAYSNYETAKRTPDIDSLMVLANYYKLTLNDLVLCDISDSFVPFSGLSEGQIPYIYTKSENIDDSIYLSEEELDFIFKLRSASPENKQLILGFLSNAK